MSAQEAYVAFTLFPTLRPRYLPGDDGRLLHGSDPWRRRALGNRVHIQPPQTGPSFCNSLREDANECGAGHSVEEVSASKYIDLEIAILAAWRPRIPESNEALHLTLDAIYVFGPLEWVKSVSSSATGGQIWARSHH